MTALDRRNFLTAMASVAAGAGLLGASELRASTAPRPAASQGTPRHATVITAADGTTLFHKDWGAGTPVVFLAAWSSSSEFWEYQMTSLLQHGLRCVGYDRRGHGRSGSPGHGYDFDTLSADLAAVLEGLDLRETILVGHSAGNGEIVRYLSRYGSGRIAGAVLVAPALPFLLKTADNPDGIDRSVFEAIRTALARDRPRWLAEGTPPFFGGPGAVSEERMRWGVSQGLQTSLHAALEFHQAFTETDFRAELQAIEVPVLVIHGDRDTSAPFERTGRKTAARIPGARLEVYEGAAHGLPITHADRLNADLVAFARSPRGAAPGVV